MMVRSTVFLLLFIIVFLTGIVYGSNQDTKDYTNQPEENVEDVYDDENGNDAEEIDALTINEELIEANDGYIESAIPHQSLTLTQKTASFLEVGVKGFYNVVVDVLYQFSKLFF